MAVNVTPEVASAHKNLRNLCEKFETSVDEFCASPLQSIRPHEFYECECVPMAAACADALSKLESACSHEVTRCESAAAEANDTFREQKRKLEESAAQRKIIYEGALTEANDTLREQKRKLEESAAQRKIIYEGALTEADNTLREQKRKLEESAAQRTKTYESAVAEANETYRQVKSELESDADQTIQHIEHEVWQVDVDFTFSQEKTTVKSNSKIPYSQALERVNHVLEEHESFFDYVKAVVLPLLGGCLFLFWPIGGCALWGYRESRQYTEEFSVLIESFKDTFLLIVIVPMILVIMLSLWRHNRKPRALRALRSAAVAERNIILDNMEKAIANASAERDRKVKDAHARKEEEEKQAAEVEAIVIASAERDKNAKVKDARARKEREERQAAETEAMALASRNKKVEEAHSKREREKCQAAETEAMALASRDKKVDDARSKRDRAIAYIHKEYQVFDTRLCQCLNKFQSLVDTWIAENFDVTSVLGENRVQNLSQNGDRIGSHLTRVGTVGIWNLS